MAKNDTGKIRVVVFEMEGNNETLQEGMRTVAHALTRNTIQRIASPALTGSSITNTTAAIPAQTVLDIVEDEQEESSATAATKKN